MIEDSAASGETPGGLRADEPARTAAGADEVRQLWRGAVGTDLPSRVRDVWDRVGRACAAAGRPRSSVRLLPVSKTHSAASILAVDRVLDTLATREEVPAGPAGRRLFGENHVQEIVAKSAQLAGHDVGLALIGHLQSNKVNAVAGLVEEFQALDSLKLAAKLDRRLSALGVSLRVLVEVNTSGEQAKHGVPMAEATALCRRLGDFDCLEVAGLMTVAVNSPDRHAVAACFDRLAGLQTQLRDDAVLDSSWPELSMGMSGDFELAIAHGATTVRVGTALFGPRDYGQGD
ncbi:YggS family pyridoxal phosphate-dependent enzyme [Propionibacterium cyclohexanicum]|nr:YggS family pyridoxal phosphate-dependent enzyme [Propionibacterium cyclohexanicum]